MSNKELKNNEYRVEMESGGQVLVGYRHTSLGPGGGDLLIEPDEEGGIYVEHAIGEADEEFGGGTQNVFYDPDGNKKIIENVGIGGVKTIERI